MRLLLPALVGLVAACGNDEPLPVLDLAASVVDQAVAQSGCGGDVDCGGATPRCDRNTRRCSPCLPLNDNCPRGERCVAAGGGYLCAATCVVDNDCPPTGAGVPQSCCGGVCRDTTSDPLHCGGCSKPCPLPVNATPVCHAGACVLGPCNLGFLDCDANPGDGCEVDATSDVNHCGTCGNRCSAGANQVVGCTAGVCQQPCVAGFAHCTMNPNDGCETSTLTDVRHCGACGNACPAPPNTTRACQNGQCAVGGCRFGFADCNKLPLDGCEADLQGIQDCGTCGTVCPVLPNASAGCNAGVCGIGACDALFGDCDGNPANGCEKGLGADVNHCGACATVCAYANARGACLNGQCGLLACNQGFADCDLNAANGCEVSTASDPRNCGACGGACPQNLPACVDGKCGPVFRSCLEFARAGAQRSGPFMIDPDGAGPIAQLMVYCDMTSDGGGWTIVYSSGALDAEVGITSDVPVAGDALSFAYSNQARAVKVALSAISTESLFRRRQDGAWIKASSPLFDKNLVTPNSHVHTLVKLTSSDGAMVQGSIGYSNFNTAGGGDYGVTVFPDGATCSGNTVNGFDHHSASYFHLNCGCQRHYLYSYSNNVQDADQSYNINTGLGAWTATQACASVEGGGLSFYAAVR